MMAWTKGLVGRRVTEGKSSEAAAVCASDELSSSSLCLHVTKNVLLLFSLKFYAIFVFCVVLQRDFLIPAMGSVNFG